MDPKEVQQKKLHGFVFWGGKKVRTFNPSRKEKQDQCPAYHSLLTVEPYNTRGKGLAVSHHINQRIFFSQ